MNWKRIYDAQVDESNCGVAALSMLMKFYGSKIPLAQLREYAKTTTEGTRIYGVKSEATKEFNILTGEVVKYFDVIDTVSAWIGSIKSGQELYDIIFSKVANEHSNLLNVEKNNGVYTVSSGNSNKLERISTGREFSSDKIFLRKTEKDTFNLNKQKNDNIVLPNTGEKGYNLLSLIGIFELIIVITTFFKKEKIYNEKNG